MSNNGDDEISPYKQGSLDHWCGLYSIVNTIHLLAGPFGDCDCVDIFADVQRELLKLRKGRLTARVETGVTTQEMKALLAIVAEEFGFGFRTLRRDVGARRLTTLFGYWRALQCYLERANGRASSLGEYTGQERGVAVVYVRGFLRHWTVVRAVTNREMLLFDSCGFERLARRRMVIGKRTPARSRVICGACTLLVYRRD